MTVDFVLLYSAQLFTVAQVGRLGALELSAFSLANSLFNIMGFAVVIGLSAAIDTLAGQAFGAMQYALLGAILQRGLLICMLAAAVPMMMWAQAFRLMMAIGAPPPPPFPLCSLIQRLYGLPQPAHVTLPGA